MRHGIEQEFQVVNEKGRLVPRTKDILEHIPDKYKEFGKGGIYQDKYPTQLEIATDVAGDLDELREQLLELREIICRAAEKEELFLIGSGANPVTSYRVGEFFSEHHHLDAATPEDKVRLNNFLRIFTPDLMAVSVNSPILYGRATRYQSYRASGEAMRRPNPNIKPAPYVTIEDVERGRLSVYDRKKSRYFDITPFTKEDRITGEYKPTIEIRLLDMQPSIAITIAYAAILQALAKKSESYERLPDVNVAGNRDLAVSKGLRASFIACESGFDRCTHSIAYHFTSNLKRSLQACGAFEELIQWVEPELKELGYMGYVSPLENMVKQRRTLADWQLSLFKDGMDSLLEKLEHATMKDYDKEIITTRTIKLVSAEELQRKEKLPKLFQEAVEKLKIGSKKVIRPEIWARTNCVAALAQLHVKDDGWFQEQISRLNRMQGPDGSIKNNLYYTASFLDALRACKLSTDISTDMQFDSALKWMLQQKEPTWTEEVWLNSYILSVLNRSGVREEDVEEQLHWLESRQKDDGSFGDVWVTAFAVEALGLYGRDIQKSKEWLMNNKTDGHWQVEDKDPALLTALILRALESLGERYEDTVGWLNNQMPKHTPKDSRELYKLAVILQSLSEEAASKSQEE